MASVVSLLGSLADAAVQASGPGLSRPAFISRALEKLNFFRCHDTTSLVSLGLVGCHGTLFSGPVANAVAALDSGCLVLPGVGAFPCH
jgi:hypothetical protein